MFILHAENISICRYTALPVGSVYCTGHNRNTTSRLDLKTQRKHAQTLTKRRAQQAQGWNTRAMRTTTDLCLLYGLFRVRCNYLLTYWIISLLTRLLTDLCT